MIKFGVGQSVTRVEDRRLLTGDGRYADDINLDGQAYAHFVRSPHAHAQIENIDASAALGLPGVIAVFTIADVDADGLDQIRSLVPIKNSDGSDMVEPDYPLLARGRVRHVGNMVAMVLAESEAAARDAGEEVAIDYRPLPAAIDTLAAMREDAPLVWEEAPGNICFDSDKGDRAATDEGFARAAHTVAVELVNNRLVSNTLEGRVALAAYDPGRDHYTVTVTTQGVHNVRARLEQALKHPADRITVRTHDVGGGFGTKIFPLSRIRPGRLGGEEDRPARQMDQRSQPRLPHRRPRPRQRDARRAGARCRGQDAGAARHDLRQSRRLPVQFREPDFPPRTACIRASTRFPPPTSP